MSRLAVLASCFSGTRTKADTIDNARLRTGGSDQSGIFIAIAIGSLKCRDTMGFASKGSHGGLQSS
jgi:hypothetical protein